MLPARCAHFIFQIVPSCRGLWPLGPAGYAIPFSLSPPVPQQTSTGGTQPLLPVSEYRLPSLWYTAPIHLVEMGWECGTIPPLTSGPQPGQAPV
jgi:hypothetical protein